ncbi:hypothetical protein AVEN_58987-1, partial [Araneus ventricosus]
NGLASCLPILITTVSGVLSSLMSHWITKKNLIGLNNLRKIATGSSALGFSLCMVGILLAGCDAIINILFFALSLFSLGIALSGIVISGVDMAPVFSAKLIFFLTENDNLIKQPPDATSSSDSDPDFSPSPRPQTYGLRSSRGPIPRTLISPLTSV